MLALLGWLAAMFLALKFAGTFSVLLVTYITLAWMRWIVAFLAIFLSVLLVLGLLRFLLKGLLSLTGMSPIDRLFGALFGLGRAVVVAVIVVALAGLTAIPKENWWRDAVFAPPLETAVIAAKPWLPKELAARIKYR